MARVILLLCKRALVDKAFDADKTRVVVSPYVRELALLTRLQLVCFHVCRKSTVGSCVMLTFVDSHVFATLCVLHVLVC